MSEPAPQNINKVTITLPAIPVLAVNATQAALLSVDGEISLLSHQRAQIEIAGKPVLVCHAPYSCKRLEAKDILAFDILELFAFVHPAQFTVPTPAGLAKKLGFSAPESFEDYPFTILEAAQALLTDLRKETQHTKRANPAEIAQVMGLQGKGWNWTPYVCGALGMKYDAALPVTPKSSLNIWKHLPEWSEEAPPPPPAHHAVTGEESRHRLGAMLQTGDFPVEPRAQQNEYTTALTAAFSPLQDAEEPHLVLGEAGTGVGKTIGYLAPATVWAEKNQGSVWVSTYTKNLQKQIVQELDRAYPAPAVKEHKVAVRKGRENYLCLLNLEDTVAGAGLARDTGQAIAAGLMTRWAEATNDGDMQGGDFPGWLPGLLGHKYTRGLSDKRGECIYGACDHYHKCYVERSIRKAQRADIVVANHALVMRYTADAGEDTNLPKRYIFDEGHHLFDAADSAFAAHLTARETADLRRWVLGPEGGKKSRARGLKRRVEDLIEGDEASIDDLNKILYHAQALPSMGWTRRLKDKQPSGPVEDFLHAIYQQVYARSAGRDGPYSLETQTRPLIDEIPSRAQTLQKELRQIQDPMKKLAARLRKNIVDGVETLAPDTKRRLESVQMSMAMRILHLGAWVAMLDTLLKDEATDPAGFVDWMEIERIEGQAYDVGLYRHYTDPMAAFGTALKPHAHGVAITSATLRDQTGNEEEEWRSACERTGAGYLTDAPSIFAANSPYDYAAQTKIFVVGDVQKNNMDQVASAYRALFETAGGGSLGLFTAIQRLRAVQQRIIQPLEQQDIALYAQHVDAIDTATLVDIFREDTHACLLGTDAVRDGVDVPGESLRLLVYDRVPWPRPTILHKARREAFGKRSYDEMMTRMKLRQAYGRLIRRECDKGVFVMLDSMLPTRLLTAFPEGVEVQRIGLADTISAIKEFLG